jgi:hypothetical protein
MHTFRCFYTNERNNFCGVDVLTVATPEEAIAAGRDLLESSSLHGVEIWCGPSWITSLKRSTPLSDGVGICEGSA